MWQWKEFKMFFTFCWHCYDETSFIPFVLSFCTLTSMKEVLKWKTINIYLNGSFIHYIVRLSTVDQ